MSDTPVTVAAGTASSVPAATVPASASEATAQACATWSAIAACPACRADDQPRCAEHEGRAAALARDLVAATPGLTEQRKAHTLAVGATVERWTRARWNWSPMTRDLLVAAATVHDVGYAYPATGLHFIDGARHLVDCGAPGLVAVHVAWHSTAEHEAREHGLDLTRTWSRPDELQHALIWVADFTTDPTGQPCSLTDRIAGILTRYPHDHPAVKAVRSSIDDLISAGVMVDRFLGVGTVTW